MERTSRERAPDGAAACFERRLAALLSEIENPLASAETLHARSDSCAEAFEALAAGGELDGAQGQRLRALLAAALGAAHRELDSTASRLKLARSALRATTAADSSTPVGDWCDIAG
jgi:hypothetical protein